MRFFDGKLTVIISDLEPGTYGIAMIDDKNENGKMEVTDNKTEFVVIDRITGNCHKASYGTLTAFAKLCKEIGV